jgi:hypothetical protein
MKYINVKAGCLLLLFSLCVQNFSTAQKINDNYKYNIQKISSPIKIDGILDDAAWQSAEMLTDFHTIWPMDTSIASIRTEVKMSFDDNNIYISAVNFIPHKRYMVESLRRDWAFQKNDNFIFIMDTYNDLTNGFLFGVNAAGAQDDGQQFDGGPVNYNWDNKWHSVVKQYDDKWVFEGAIPFKSIRYNPALKSWGINFSRNDLVSTEKSSWAPVPRQFPSVASAFTGNLVWPDLPPKAGSNIGVIPYALTGVSKNYEKNTKATYKKEIGGDVKVALGSALNLDLTVNPDFSQVEVDRQQTNLDRFELFFPERRQFFLENDDLFNNLGLERIRPFFSRRIGLGVPINYGARLSGKLNKSLRIGAMNIGTSGVDETNIDGQNFSVLTLQQKVFSRSNITGFLVNKDEIGTKNFNRNVGLEYNLASHNNKWRGKFMYYNSDNQKNLKDNATLAGLMTYNDRHWNIMAQYEKVGSNYDAQVGYFQRSGYSRINPRIGYAFLPKKGIILSHGPSSFNFTFFNKQQKPVEYTTGIVYNAEFRNRSNISWYFAKDFIKLLSEFDPTNYTGIKLPIGSEHTWYSSGITFNSKPQSFLTYGFESRYGGYYADGTRLRLATTLGYRIQPYVQVAVASEINSINLPENKGLKDARFWLISPRVDVTLTNNLYFTTFLQYNQQVKNTNVNARLQWRYKPVSDIYLVYTDNYGTEELGLKNRAVVLKMTYWGNM